MDKAWFEFADDMGLSHSTRPDYCETIVKFLTDGFIRGCRSKQLPVSHWAISGDIPFHIHLKIYLINDDYFTIDWYDNSNYLTGYVLYNHLPYKQSHLGGGMFALESLWLIADYALNQFDLDFDNLRPPTLKGENND